MYDRAPRRFGPTVGSTSEMVGPGSYEAIDGPTKSTMKTDGFAPFASMAGRDTSMVTDAALTLPGPGAYDHGLPSALSKFSAPRGCRALANRARRFEDRPGADFPGPGAYEVNSATTPSSSKTPGGGGAPGSASALEKKPEVVVNNRLKFLRKPEAPSIPTPGQAYGYEENDDGTLRKQEPPDQDSTIGPAFYAPAGGAARATALYRGVFFGNKTARRDFAPAASATAAAAAPGPADYDLIGAALRRAAAKEPSRMALEAVTGLGAQQKPDAKLPRYHEIVTNEASKLDVPGPGRYDVSSQFDPKPKVTFDGYEVERPPFGTQEKRFRESQPRRLRAGGLAAATPPGPGAYTDPRTALEAPKKLSSLKKCPFNQTALRFESAVGIGATPGPGRYNLMGMAAESVKKAYFASTTRGAFGSTEVRKTTFLGAKKDETAPGPANYAGSAPSPHDRRAPPPKPTAPFASRTRRDRAGPADAAGPAGVEETPAPGSYDVVEAFERLANKKSLEPRTSDARRRQGAFLSGAPRMVPAGSVSAEAVPGPGAYDAADSDAARHVGGKFVFKERRFKDFRREARPGPAHYELSPQVQDTLLKSTFNVTLSNPIAQKLEERQQSHGGSSARALMGTG